MAPFKPGCFLQRALLFFGPKHSQTLYKMYVFKQKTSEKAGFSNAFMRFSTHKINRDEEPIKTD
jgi:hypothetical protein